MSKAMAQTRDGPEMPVSPETMVRKLTPNPMMENLQFAFGCITLLAFGWYTAINILISVTCDYLDRKLFHLIPRIQEATRNFDAKKFGLPPVKDEDNDKFLWPTFLWLAVCIPAWFFYELTLASIYGVSYRRILLFNAVRLGPMYCNFMYVYALSHKEAHLNGSLMPFGSFRNFFLAKFPFNMWVGMFHGIIPGTFTYSHIYNHHKHDNSYMDVICTVHRSRDSFANFVSYLTVWIGYATNFTTIRQWLLGGPFGEEKTKHVNKAYAVIGWTGYYCAFVYACCNFQRLFGGGTTSYDSFVFTFWTLIFAVVEATLLLSMVNWVLHGFIDIRDPANPWVNSTTIVDGLHFTLAEEYHAVHHQYPGIHWSKHATMYEKHRALGEYDSRKVVAGSSPGDFSGDDQSTRDSKDPDSSDDPDTTKGSSSLAATDDQRRSDASTAAEGQIIPATGFYKENVFELFAMMVTADYHKLAKSFYQPFNAKAGLSEAELAELIKARMRYHGPIAALRCGGVEVGEDYVKLDEVQFRQCMSAD